MARPGPETREATRRSHLAWTEDRIAALALADAVLVVAGVLVAITRSGSDRVAFLNAGGSGGSPAAAAPPVSARRRPETAAEVVARPEPDRVMAKSRWGATLHGTGDRVRFYAPVMAVDAVSSRTVKLQSPDPRPQPTPGGSVRYQPGTALALPDGTRWYPLQPFTLGGAGSVSLTGVTATETTVDGTSAARLLAGGDLDARGLFVTRDGREVTSLHLPSGTRVSAKCAGPDPTQVPPPCPQSSPATSLEVSIEARSGLRLEVDAADGSATFGNDEGAVEIEVAGAVRGRVLDREWEGLAGSLEANDLEATAVRGETGWRVDARAKSARQLWIDVWPVVDTVLEARSGYDGGLHSCAGDCSVRLRYANDGYATAQIFEAEGVGGANAVDVGIKQTGTLDAGLDVHRGGREINLGSGRGIDSHLPPGDSHDRGLTSTPGVPVTLVLRGNFAEVRVPLAIPTAEPTR